MSFHQTYRAVSNPVNSYSSPSPQSSLHRKPGNYTSSTRSVSPLPPSNNQTSHSKQFLHSPTPQTPLNSFPPQAPASPSITPDPPAATDSRPADTPLYSFHSSTTVPPTSPALLNTKASTRSLRLLNTQEIDNAIRFCLGIQNQAVTEHGKRPFAALLLAPDNASVLLTHNSISHYQHAESELARLAAMQYSQKYLEKCTLVSTWEPCAMCAGTIYWTGIGRLLYAASEARLKELTGSNNNENMTMSLPCRTILQAGQRAVEVIGPVSTWEQKVVDESGKWWREHTGGAPSADLGRSTSSVKENGSIASRRTSVTVYNPNESFLGSIGEDGEYQADLKIDWMP
ncbi:hypothetical protein PMZ80_007418 [Knufia obscura]|uniref:CMP/dCMP-type deaminase domain-containing protein n=2 Tax=Knufia TaxID=430999 RepID=A0AAN8I3L2_9EURO|nr:hypothetical protein PMZ80_007418 [Knufia obscura]KAK5950494.1 hypothetical protein OHC33_008437 [Knufia fluminis]